MKTKAAILWEVGKDWSVEEIELDPPGPARCWSRWRRRACATPTSTSSPATCPSSCRSSVATRAPASSRRSAPNVSWLKPGDHVVFGFIPSCGRCPSCSTGHQNLCDLGALLGDRPADRRFGTSRHHGQGQDLKLMCLLGTFAHHTAVNEASCIKIDDDVPLDRACLLGCGVVTGWGSAVYAAETAPGDVVAVVGVGGIGANAIQGAQHRRGQADHRHRPAGEQAREGDGVRRHPHGGAR